MKKLCCNCGSPIARKTTNVFFSPNLAGTPLPRTKEEAQKYCEHPIISVSYGGEASRYVTRATCWDGKSFKDDYFCSFRCAAEYGYSAVMRKEAAE